MHLHEYRALDATALAALVKAGEVSAAELIELAIAAIGAHDADYNAVIHRRFDAARLDAARLDAARLDAARLDAAGRAHPGAGAPFAGVPFLVKDGVCHTAGDPFHNGMRVLRDIDWREPDDSHLAARYRRAGFVPVGRTNLPELALMATTEPLAYGPTRNPWDPAHSPGGSSGGSAVAVALGYVPAAHGNDMGGSIRIPASACGLVGLKPTRARHSLGPAFGEFWGPTTHEHVLTRTVRDSAAILDATHGMEPGDPYTAPAPARPFAHEVGVPPGRLRIGLRLSAGNDAHPVDPECAAAAEAAARLCASLGHIVVDDRFDALDDPGPAAAGLMFTVFAARDVARWSARIGRIIGLDELEATNAYMCEIGNSVSGPQYLDALEQAQSWSRRAAAWWAGGNDVLITPTLGALPPRLGLLGPHEDPAVAFGRAGALTSFVAPFNLTGQPAVSLPLGTSASGLPIGVQFVAAYGREDVLIRLASQLEAAAPWAERRPVV